MTMDHTQGLMKSLLDFAFAQQPQSPHHITRFAMYRALTGLWATHDAPTRRALSLSRSDALLQTLGLRQAAVQQANYPEFDLLALALPDNVFDFVASDQVLEHVQGPPHQAMAESVRVARPGGLICHTTCFALPIHQDPADLWRYTPQALATLLDHSGADVLVADGWGNREALSLMHMGYWSHKIPLDSENPVHRIATRQEASFPIVVWCVGRKRG